MFGLYRLVLALLVALSHYGMQIAGFNPGQWAVICFYVLSGFLMDRQFKKLAPEGGVRAFYVDRFLRVFPLYCFVVVLGMAIAPIPWHDFWINLTLFPLNYAFFTKVPVITGPAWSLACEAHFYVLVPLLVFLPQAWLRAALVGSLLLFSLSPFLPDATFWTYIGLPGILFTFLSGILINRQDWRILRLVYSAMGMLLLLFLGGKIMSVGLRTGININVCLGYLSAIPATCHLARFSPKVKWDQVLGLFSYPLFLVHTLVRTFAQVYFPHLNVVGVLGMALLASAVLTFMVEKPFDYVRYRIRKIAPRSRPAP
jgi:peptidoglycan/LPS O-acetylase OafA/YrhL